MLNPYRHPPESQHDEEVEATDDRILGILLVVVGALRVLIALVRREQFGAEATIAGLMVAVGIALLRRS